MSIARPRVLSALFLLTAAACSSSPSSTGGLDNVGLDQGAGGDGNATGGTGQSQGKSGASQNPTQGAGGTAQTQGAGGSAPSSVQGAGGAGPAPGKGGSSTTGAGGAGNSTSQGTGGAGNGSSQGTGGVTSFGAGGAGTGKGGSSSGKAGSGQGAGAGAGGSGAMCQVFMPDMGCGSCIDAQCCDTATLCAGDKTCISCFTSMTPPASCSGNMSVQALSACAQQNCAQACGGGTGGSGQAGSGQGAGPGVGGSGPGTGGSATGGPPQNCNDANGPTGCCAADGNVYYCLDGVNVQSTMCNPGTCGWRKKSNQYECSTKGNPDPSGMAPMACGSSGGGAGPGAGGSGQGAGPGAGGSGQGAGPGAGGSGSTDPACASAGTGTWAQVSGIFQSNCAVSGCHDSGQHGINPADYASLMAGGGNKCTGLVTAGQPSQSDLINVVNGSGAGCVSMPPGANGLSASDVQTITAWICAGATQN